MKMGKEFYSEKNEDTMLWLQSTLSYSESMGSTKNVIRSRYIIEQINSRLLSFPYEQEKITQELINMIEDQEFLDYILSNISKALHSPKIPYLCISISEDELISTIDILIDRIENPTLFNKWRDGFETCCIANGKEKWLQDNKTYFPIFWTKLNNCGLEVLDPIIHKKQTYNFFKSLIKVNKGYNKIIDLINAIVARSIDIQDEIYSAPYEYMWEVPIKVMMENNQLNISSFLSCISISDIDQEPHIESYLLKGLDLQQEDKKWLRIFCVTLCRAVLPSPIIRSKQISYLRKIAYSSDQGKNLCIRSYIEEIIAHEIGVDIYSLHPSKLITSEFHQLIIQTTLDLTYYLYFKLDLNEDNLVINQWKHIKEVPNEYIQIYKNIFEISLEIFAEYYSRKSPFPLDILPQTWGTLEKDNLSLDDEYLYTELIPNYSKEGINDLIFFDDEIILESCKNKVYKEWIYSKKKNEIIIKQESDDILLTSVSNKTDLQFITQDINSVTFWTANTKDVESNFSELIEKERFLFLPNEKQYLLFENQNNQINITVKNIQKEQLSSFLYPENIRYLIESKYSECYNQILMLFNYSTNPWDKSLALVDITTGKLIKKIDNQSFGYDIKFIKLSSSGSRLIANDQGMIFSVETLQPTTYLQLPLEDTPIYWEFSPDDLYVVGLSTTAVHIFLIETGVEIKRIACGTDDFSFSRVKFINDKKDHSYLALFTKMDKTKRAAIWDWNELINETELV